MFKDGIEVIVSDVDRYLQINDVSGMDLAEICEQIKSDYSSYEKWICYHNYADIPFELLEEMGTVIEDNSIEMRLTANDFINFGASDVVQITMEELDDFAAYHNKCNPDNGANSERIKRNFSNWGIFALFADNKISDYVIIAMGNPNQAEIFCVESSDKNKCEKLISFATKHAFDSGKREVLFMADENTIAYKVALSGGFCVTGFYKGYRIYE